MNARPLWIAILLGALAFAPARAESVDEGSFKVYRFDEPLGAETFAITLGHDSLAVMARQYLTLPTSNGGEPIERNADLLVSRTDFSLRGFTSTRTFQGRTIKRGVTVADTHYVCFRQDDVGGEGVSYVLPPGRIYVMDSQLITMFDLICRSFQDRAFRSRDINLLALGPRDTMLTAHARVAGSETIRWGGKPVTARKLLLSVDDQTTFTLWIGPQGRLLRLVEPVGGLRAERAPPASPGTKGGSAPPTSPKPRG
jgi:hypothetical protein